VQQCAAHSDNRIATTKHYKDQATKHINSRCYLKDSNPTICCFQDITRQVNTHETWGRKKKELNSVADLENGTSSKETSLLVCRTTTGSASQIPCMYSIETIISCNFYTSTNQCT
jgi:hypothetical protein